MNFSEDEDVETLQKLMCITYVRLVNPRTSTSKFFHECTFMSAYNLAITFTLLSAPRSLKKKKL